MIWNLLSLKFINSVDSHGRLSGLLAVFSGSGGLQGEELPSTWHSEGVSGCPEWSPAPDGNLPAPCSSPEPDASTAPPLTAAGRRPARAWTRWSPGGAAAEGERGCELTPCWVLSDSEWTWTHFMYYSLLLGQLFGKAAWKKSVKRSVIVFFFIAIIIISLFARTLGPGDVGK